MDTTAKVTHKFEWKICNFTKEALEKTLNKYISSKIVKIAIQDKTFECYFVAKVIPPNFGLYLRFSEHYQDNYQVKFKAWIQKCEKDTKQEYVRKLSEFDEGGWGWKSFLDTTKVFADPKKYLEDGNTLNIALKVKITREPSSATVIILGSEFFNSQKSSNVSFKCLDNIKIPAHELVLRTNSKVFDAMFDTKMKESRSKVINVEDIDGETMREILRFMYTRKVENLEALATKILYGAEKYGLFELKSLCVSSMLKKLSTDNVIEYFILAERYNEDYLLKKCAKFIKLNYKSVRSKARWADIDQRLQLALLDYFGCNTRHFHNFNSFLYSY